jgi:hypothetical protein
MSRQAFSLADIVPSNHLDVVTPSAYASRAWRRIREKRPGVWEVRVFTGSDTRGRPTQLSRTVRGGKREALRVAAELDVGPGRSPPAGRSVSDVLDALVDQNVDTLHSRRLRDQQSRMRLIKKDQIARVPLACLTVGDVERWHTRLRAAGMADAGIKNQHGVLRAALSQAMRWAARIAPP